MYRILTENKNIEAVKALLWDLGLDFTVYYGDGSWKGTNERTLLIELDRASEKTAELAAQLIKRKNLQEAVLLQEIPVRSKLL